MLLRSVLALCCLIGVAALACQGQQAPAVLDKSVNGYSLGPATFVEALIQASKDFQIPMGIAWIDSTSARAKLPFAWESATVHQIFDTIVGSQYGYEMRTKNGVILVSPSQALITDKQNFLKMRLESFRAADDFVEVASFKLHMQIAPRRYGGISIGATGDSKVNLEMTGATVEDVLNALLLASNRKIWVATFLDNPTVTPRGKRRTISLWSGKPQPDDEQPGWDLFRWGDPLPPGMTAARP